MLIILFYISCLIILIYIQKVIQFLGSLSDITSNYLLYIVMCSSSTDLVMSDDMLTLI